MNKFWVVLFTVFIALGSSACSATFHGRVIDADTKEPIEGAVLVASWDEEKATVAGPTGRLKDVKETLTNKNGEWKMRGPRGRWGGNCTACFTFVTGTYYTNPPSFIVFKPGYCSWPNGYLIDACKGMRPDGGYNGGTAELPKLINREDRLRNLPDFTSDSEGLSYKEAVRKQKEFIRLLNEEHRSLGIKEYQMKELKNEK